MRHILLTADSPALLVGARTSTTVLDATLRTVAEGVGGAAPSLIARFKNSLNRPFHNLTVI